MENACSTKDRVFLCKNIPGPFLGLGACGVNASVSQAQGEGKLFLYALIASSALRQSWFQHEVDVFVPFCSSVFMAAFVCCRAVSIQFEDGVFPGRRFFAPTALYNKMLDELQFCT